MPSYSDDGGETMNCWLLMFDATPASSMQGGVMKPEMHSYDFLTSASGHGSMPHALSSSITASSVREGFTAKPKMTLSIFVLFDTQISCSGEQLNRRVTTRKLTIDRRRVEVHRVHVRQWGLSNASQTKTRA